MEVRSDMRLFYRSDAKTYVCICMYVRCPALDVEKDSI